MTTTTTPTGSAPAGGPLVYRGLNQRERAGWIAGLTPIQALACAALTVPVLLAVSAGHWARALELAGVDGLIAMLVILPVRGRPAARWLWHLVRYQAGVATGWSSWQSAAAAGAPGPAEEPDLPGVLTRLELFDGPTYRTQGRVCLIHDTVEGRWAATARLTHGGVGMLSDVECERLAARLGGLLLSMSHRGIVDRLSLMVRTVPDDGTDYEVWCAEHRVADTPPLAAQVAAELGRTIGGLAVRTELFVTVAGTDAALRGPAKAAGGGRDGRAYALYRALDGIEERLKAVGVRSVSWLPSSGLAEAIRTGFNPDASRALRHGRLTHPGEQGWPLSLAGPTQAPAPSPRSYSHDGFTTVSYAVLMPEAGTVFGSLGPLVAVRTAGERRSLAIHYQVLDATAGARAVAANRFQNTVVQDFKARKGFVTSAAQQRQACGAADQEHAVAAGHSMVRFTVAAAVTVPSHWNVEDHAARLENAAAGRFRLLRLDLAQPAAFAAACLPVGMGLPRLRGSFG